MKAVKRNRPYQSDGITALVTTPYPRALFCLATGLGKTHVAAQLPDALGAGRVLVLAHREELVQQLADAFACAGTVGIEKAEQRVRGDERVVVASTQTLAISPQRFEALNPDSFDLVIRDEAHHALARTELALWRRLGFLDEKNRKTSNPRARLVGLTATPGRSDGEALRALFDGIAYSMSLPDGIRAGFLVPIEAYTIETETVLDVAVRGGDYAPEALADAVNVETRHAAIFDAYERHAAGLRALIFGVNVKHAQDMAAFFEARGRAARCVHGGLGSDERRDAFAWFAETPGAILTNCALVDEGTDVPGIECVAMAAPTRSAIRYAQRVGRGTRLAPGAHDITESIALGKSRLVLLDATDATQSIGRQAFSIHDLFGLPKRRPLRGEDVLEELAKQEEEEETAARAAEEARIAQRVRTSSYLVDIFAASTSAVERLPTSTMAWISMGSSTFSLGLPDRKRIRVSEDALGGWHCDVFDGEEWKRVSKAAFVGDAGRDDIVRRAERLARTMAGALAGQLMRTARWRSDPPTEKQLATARRCRIPLRDGATKGEVSAAIDAFFARANRRSV